MFKKKSLKFQYEKVSRDMRHAETVKARESSRFKRLSTLRSINDSYLNEKSMETPNHKAPECKKPSRLEMLFKWKQEKQIKKEMEQMKKKKPFYTGGNKNVVENKSFKSSFIAQSNSSSFNSSKFTKSKLLTPNAIVQPSRILNAKQITPNAVQSSRILNGRQGTPGAMIQSKIPNSKQGAAVTTSQLPKIAVSKQNILPKASNLSRSNSTAATLSRKYPISAVSSSVDRTGNTLTRSNSTIKNAKKIPTSVSGINKDSNKAVPLKATNNIKKGPLVNRTTTNVPSSANAAKSNISKPIYKGVSEAKFVSKRPEEKPVKKIGTGLSKLTSNVAAVPKGISVQNKLPVVSNGNKKLNPKDTAQPKENLSSRKGYCFKTAIANSIHQRAGTLLKTPLQGTPKKPLVKTVKKIEKSSTTELCEQSLDCIPDVTFNSDISIIKPARPSFAPAKFTFQPPEGLNNFVFEDDDCDIYQAIEDMKQKFMSRTSTPSKDSGRKSSIKRSKESVESNLKEEEGKASDLSNSNDINISELMTPVSLRIKTDSEKTDETSTKATCNEVVSDIDLIITDTENKEVDISVSPQASDEVVSVSPIKTLCKEIDVLANHMNEELNFNSPIRIATNEIGVSENQQACEQLTSISSIKMEINTDKTMNQQTTVELNPDINKDLKLTEIAEEKADNELQKSLPDEKKIFYSDITEGPKENTVESDNSKLEDANINENPPNQSPKNGFSESSAKESLFFDDDDDFLLDSIDLNKIELLKLDDEDTDEDQVPSPSPQILKCPERKSNGAVPGRVSMLKNLAVMNSIAENIETNEHGAISLDKSSKNNENIRNTPRRSKRISKLLSIDESPLKNGVDSPKVTPRRSLRLMKVSSANDDLLVSPFQEKNTSKANVRRSVRLIDLNTPEKAACGKVLGEDLENYDPNKFLIDFESPDMPALPKSRKVSLLYSPERRKSIRKSIRGDLMSFSPV